MDNIRIENRTFPFEFVYETLRKVSPLFTPPLSESLDIQTYARKLSLKALFVACMSGNDLLGFTAYYLNSAAHQVYVTLICVEAKHQARGIGGKMLEHIAASAKTIDKNYDTIALEVNKRNNKAYSFYLRQGFKEKEDRGYKFLMVKTI